MGEAHAFTEAAITCKHLTPEWNIDNSTLEGHQRCQGLNLLQIHLFGIANSALARGTVMAMLSPICTDHVNRAVVLHVTQIACIVHRRGAQHFNDAATGSAQSSTA